MEHQSGQRRVRSDGWIARFVRWMAQQRWFRIVGPVVVPRLDRLLNRLTGGRFVLASLYLDAVVLVTMGRRSGRRRESPVASFVVDGTRVVVGSNFGRESHPAWTWNLLAEPEAEIEHDGRREPVRARLLSGDDRDRVWRDVVAQWPPFRTYEQTAGGRELRVFALEPR